MSGDPPRRPPIDENDLRELADGMMKIDPSGRLLCAWGLEQRDMVGRLLERKAAGWSNAEIEAAADREMRDWHAKGPAAIIREFDERMRRGTA